MANRSALEERRRLESQRAIERGEPDPWAIRNSTPAAQAPSESLADRVVAANVAAQNSMTFALYEAAPYSVIG
ncbi:MAG TPA: hypothetical protein VL173_10020 [Vicinamibacterales bacterium]|nr:hypothetical protein [Vicinamibacterales bacterium]